MGDHKDLHGRKQFLGHRVIGPDRKKVIDEVNRLIQSSGETKKSIAKNLGVSINTLTGWQKGNYLPCSKMLDRIRKYRKTMKIVSRFGFDCPNDPRIDS